MTDVWLVKTIFAAKRTRTESTLLMPEESPEEPVPFTSGKQQNRKKERVTKVKIKVVNLYSASSRARARL